jgi:hypothetical protein
VWRCGWCFAPPDSPEASPKNPSARSTSALLHHRKLLYPAPSILRSDFPSFRPHSLNPLTITRTIDRAARANPHSPAEAPRTQTHCSIQASFAHHLSLSASRTEQISRRDPLESPRLLFWPWVVFFILPLALCTGMWPPRGRVVFVARGIRG